jgi:uncharacterized protein (TIGR03790 family)
MDTWNTAFRYGSLTDMYRIYCLVTLFLLATSVVRAFDATQILVVYRAGSDDLNRNGMGDSEEIARYYAERRGVPASNLLSVKVSFGDNGMDNPRLSWPWAEFRKDLVEPVCKRLNSLGRDRMRVILLCPGIPARVMNPKDKEESADLAIGCPFLINNLGTNFRRSYEVWTNRYGMPRFDEFRVNRQGPDDETPYLVSRIDGINVNVCKSQIDGAIYAETYAVDGFAYLDTRYGDYSDDDLRKWIKNPYYNSYADIDKSMALASLFYADAKLKIRKQVDYEVVGDAKPGLKYTDGTPATSAPRALLYAGWYNYGQYMPVWDWMPGSVAVDFNSASLYGPRTVGASFGGMALFNGANGVTGCFTEPGSMGHSMPDVLMYYYTKGYTFAEAAWLSIPAKPMFCYSIGDPLMNPYGLGRGPDTRIEEPDVTLDKDGKNVVVRIRMKGRADIARARVITLDKADDSRLPPATWKDGLFLREHLLTTPVPSAKPAVIGVVVTDPAGNTARVWKDWVL